MSRRPRHDHPGSWYHVMNRGVDRQPIFLDDSDRVDFGEQLGVGHERFGVEVHAYCLMTNHYHLLVRCPHGDLSPFMRDVFAAFTRHVNDRHGRDGPLFRGRFHSTVVDTDAYILCAVRYIHRNALDLPGIASVDDYRWSSHRAYLGYRRQPSWLRTDHVLGLFDDDPRRFAEFVAGDDPVPAGHGMSAESAMALIGMVVDEQLAPHPNELLRLRKIVAMLAHAASGVSVERSPLAEELPQSAGAYRVALSRARRAAAADPRLSAIAGVVRPLAA